MVKPLYYVMYWNPCTHFLLSKALCQTSSLAYKNSVPEAEQAVPLLSYYFI